VSANTQKPDTFSEFSHTGDQVTSISIVDYGVGNLASIANMIRKVGGDPHFLTHPDQLEDAQKILFPGVGAWDAALNAIQARGFATPLRKFAASGRPLLGICLGMQLLFESSEEGSLDGLGLLQGKVRKFDAQSLRVPHMGWNVVVPTRPTRLFPDEKVEQRFYFAHSFYAEAADPSDVIGKANYGSSFACAFERGNIFGAQFHPEKSHRFGMNLFSRFLAV
jgi:glutamine amidotransferase